MHEDKWASVPKLKKLVSMYLLHCVPVLWLTHVDAITMTEAGQNDRVIPFPKHSRLYLLSCKKTILFSFISINFIPLKNFNLLRQILRPLSSAEVHLVQSPCRVIQRLHSRLACESYPFQILIRLSAILTEVFHYIPHYRQVNVRAVPLNKPRPPFLNSYLVTIVSESFLKRLVLRTGGGRK
jgi:hypothetical protein